MQLNKVFETRSEAEVILFRMREILDAYGRVTMGDYYDLIGQPVHYMSVKHGWTDLTGASIRLEDDGYVICLPMFQTSEETKECCVTEPDMVSHPPHYQAKNGMEVIDVIEAFTAKLTGIEATDTGNIIKYICRWKEKNGIQDLEKARWYINHLINHLEKEND